MRDIGKTQRMVSNDTGIEYTALNTFLNKRKGMWFSRVQQVLDYVGLSATGSVPPLSHQSIQKAAWLEMRCKRKHIKDVASDVGVSNSSLQLFLTGKGGMPIDKVEGLMKTLDINLIPSD